jgi:(E)-4-hydroxy-3-methylbut-2-enyl-diphosphate synthase
VKTAKTVKTTKIIRIGGVLIGGGNPTAIQSMNNTDTRDATATINQIKELEEAGCEITRLAIPDQEAADALKKIKKSVKIPIVADIHFDYRLALSAIENGADKLRINPGNIGGPDRVKKVVEKAKEYNIPIRIGVNSGSLEKGVTPVESALKLVKFLEDLDFGDIVVSIKSSNVNLCVKYNLEISKKIDYPLHIGITEAGTAFNGAIKSAVGLSAVLREGVGDTIRVSLTGDPVAEVECAKQILQCLELRSFGVNFISCPTCGRTQIDLPKLALEVEEACKGIKKNISVAVMGCVVNGPGEARDADFGVAGGKGSGIIFRKGEIIKKVPESELAAELIKEILKNI